MKPAARVRDCMRQGLFFLRPEMEVLHALNLLLERKLPSAPVVSGEGQLVGMLSQKDCLRPAIQAAYFQEWGNPVSQYMTREVETLDAGLELLEAAKRFLSRSNQQFPVVEGGRLIGQISRQEVLAGLLREWK